MLIMPAIDLRGGICVRLMQGRFDDVSRYGDPVAQLQAFADAGAQWVHIVDLDGAEAQRPVQHALIADLAARTAIKVQSGGGIRTRADVAALLDAGVQRVVIGSAAVRKPEDVREWIAAFGVDRITCAFDVRRVGDSWDVAVAGWTQGAGLSLWQALDFYPPSALRHVLVTDISRDGALDGPNLQLMSDIAAARPDLQLQASGGVSTLADIAALRTTGAAAAIVGRALYERRFTLEDALAG